MRPFTQNPTLKSSQVRQHLAILVVTVIASAIPFLDQPFHMDDNFYLDMARNARAKPLYPNDAPYVFEGRWLPDMGSHSHPPLQTYFLALLQVLWGEGLGKERLYHLSALVYPIAAVVAMYFLSAHFVERPLWPSLVLAVSPVFMVMQHNLMTDLPTLSFWLVATASYLWGISLGWRSLQALSSLSLFGAMFTSYQAAALVPLLAFYQVRKGKGSGGWVVLLVPLAGMGAWLGLNYLHYHRLLLVDTIGYIQSRKASVLPALGNKLLGILEYQGWLVLFPFFLVYVLGRGARGRLLGLATLAALYLSQMVVPHYRLVDKISFIIGLVAGGLIVGRMISLCLDVFSRKAIHSGFARVEGQFLALWYFGVFGYCLFLFTEGSARYVLPLVPAVLLYFFRHLEIREISEYRLERRPFLSSAMIASGSLVLTLAWGLALSHSDLEFARVYTRAAAEISRAVPKLDQYYAGEWGFRYYFQQAGMRQLPPDETLVRGGALLVSPTLALPYDVPAGLLSMTMPFQSFSYPVGTPLRTLAQESPAAFYSTHWGLLPFSMSRANVEFIEVRQVNYMIEQLPLAKIETTSSERPWPGYLRLQGESPLAMLARPDTDILYAWNLEESLRLDLRVGISPESYREGQESPCEFEIRQCDANGAVLTSYRKMLDPGLRKEDRVWQPVRLELRSRREGAETLEFRYSSRIKAGTIAFAGCYLRKVE